MPHWRHRHIADIGRKDVLELIDGVADRGSPVMARRLHAHLTSVVQVVGGPRHHCRQPPWYRPQGGQRDPA